MKTRHFVHEHLRVIFEESGVALREEAGKREREREREILLQDMITGTSLSHLTQGLQGI